MIQPCLKCKEPVDMDESIPCPFCGEDSRCDACHASHMDECAEAKGYGNLAEPTPSCDLNQEDFDDSSRATGGAEGLGDPGGADCDLTDLES